jgi:hypothetical protein
MISCTMIIRGVPPKSMDPLYYETLVEQHFLSSVRRLPHVIKGLIVIQCRRYGSG